MMQWPSVLSFSPRYTRVSTDSDQECEKEPASRVQSRSKWSDTLTTGCGWLLAFLIGVAVTSIYHRLISGNTYGTGFRTDYTPAHAALQLTPVRFTGTPGFHKNGTAYILDPSEPRYVGPPNKEIDKAWDKLIGGRYFPVSDDQMRQTFGEGYTQYYKHPRLGYKVGLDVLHTLHCLNVLRKTIYSDYYGPFNHSTHDERSVIPHFKDYHIDHCIDLIRQSLQCHSDLTPIPVRYFEGIHRGFIDSSQEHMCRDFQKVRDWAYETFEDSLHALKFSNHTR